MPILKTKPKGPTYKSEGNETTIPYPSKKVDGYYTSMKGIYEDGMEAQHKRDNVENAKELNTDRMINHIIKSEGGTPEQYKQLLNRTAFHESAGTMDPKQRQIGGGPGRGVYQFERGKKKGGITAIKRTEQFLKDNKIEVPSWIKQYKDSTSADVSNLTREQQDILFLGNYKMHPNANFNDVMTGKQSDMKFWSKYHQTTEDPVKEQKYLSDVDRYESKIRNGDIDISKLKKGGLLYRK